MDQTTQKIRHKLWKPHNNQKEIRTDKHRFKVVVCGRQWGKTTLAINYLLEKAWKVPQGKFFYIAPSYRQAKDIAWKYLVEQYNDLPEPARLQKNESELWIQLRNGARIELKGVENADALRGNKVNGIIIDEVASIRNFKEIWEKVLRATLTITEGWVMFIGTPVGYNHFYELWLKGQAGPEHDVDFRSWRFTSYDNPYASRKEIDKAKEQLTQDAFAQEYLAEFRTFTGLIYKEFDRAVHVVEPFDVPQTWRFYRSMDFGAHNPTACLWLAIDSADNWYVVDEYYQTGRTISVHANVIAMKTNPNNYIINTWGDPSGEQPMMDYAEHGIFITPALKVFNENESWVHSGINKVKQLLKKGEQGRPRLYVFNTCTNLIREFESYRWLEQKTKASDREVPEKTDDHALDALRYALVSVEANNRQDQEVPYRRDEINSYTGY